MIIDSFKDWTLTVATDCSKDQLIHCVKANQFFTAGQDWLKELHYIVLQERWDPFETSEGLLHTYLL